MLQRAEIPVALAGVEASRAFLAPCFAGALERLVVAHVDGEARCIHLATYDGPLEVLDLPLRTILGDALRLDSAGILLAHNHPDGTALPSATDKLATHNLALAAEAIDRPLLDHLVFAGQQCCSMRRLGML